MQPTSKAPKRTSSGALFLLSIIAAQMIADTADATKSETCSTPCECSEQLRQARQHYTAKLAEAHNNANEHARQTLRLLIATTSCNKQLKAAAVPVLAAEIANWANCVEATEQLSAAYREHVPIITKAERALGIIATLTELSGEVKLQAKTGNDQLQGDSVVEENLWQEGDDRCKITNAEEGKNNFDPTNSSNKMTLPDFKTTAKLGFSAIVTAKAKTATQQAFRMVREA
uniref:Variant surface glycoprotein n=1 Tax=Trypanosoma brucei TaxID=5691 RepID=A0A1V0FYJ8_9TRYP|nr:variant surface glycoprotein [Trypanosoma brucei]